MKNSVVFVLVVFVLTAGVLAVSKGASAAATTSRPLILIPTTMGTFPTEDGWVLDPIFNTYANFIETFTRNGYTEGENFFVFPLNWQQSMVDSSTELAAFIEHVRTSTGVEKVDVVGHGQGGLIAWHYIANGGADSVERLVFLGTPILGGPAAYFASGGGVFILHASPVGRGIGQALLDAQARSAGFSTTFDYVQTHAPAFGELLPDPNWILSPYLNPVTGFAGAGHPENPFLAALGEPSNAAGLVALTTLSGRQRIADVVFGITVQESSDPPRWPYGEPTGRHVFDEGDSIFPSLPFDLYGEDASYPVFHHALPTAAQEDIFVLFNGSAPVVVANNYPISCALFVTTTPETDMQIVAPSGERLGKDFDGGGVFNEIPRSLYSGPSFSPEYAIIANPLAETYRVLLQNAKGGEFTMRTVLACGNDDDAVTTIITGESEFTGGSNEGQTVELEIIVSPDDETVVIDEPAGTPTPTATLSATPENIERGESATLEWSSTNADECVGTNFDTGGAVSGSIVVSPTETTEYTVECAGSGGSSSASVTVVVTEPPIEPVVLDVQFLPPITAAGHMTSANMSIFKAGSNVPVKFELLEEGGNRVQAGGEIAWIVPVKGPAISTSVVEPAAFEEKESSGSFYSWSGNHYQYNWKTNRAGGGYWYYLFVVLPDGSMHQTIIGLR